MEPDIEIVGEADNGEQALQLIRKLSPDITVLRDGFRIDPALTQTVALIWIGGKSCHTSP